jgi:phage gp36-like protein
MYVTLLQLAERPGPTELAERASPMRGAIVDADLLDALLRGNDTSAWPPDQVAVASETVARINDAIDDADGLIDGFLGKRGYTLPLTPVPGVVATWARAIVRYNLAKDRISDPKTDPLVRDYQDAMKLLQLTATGQFSLGIGDTVTEPGVGMPQTTRDTTCRPGPWNIPE